MSYSTYNKMLTQCRKLKAKLTGSDPIYTNQDAKILKKLSKKKSKKIEEFLRTEGRNEQKYIKLLSLGPGEAGKSTLIKQMELIHGEALNNREKMDRVKYIRQNVFDSMVAILAAMESHLDISLDSEENKQRAESILVQSQVRNRTLAAKDILYSPFLESDEFFEHIECLWEDSGVRRAYARSNEYQLLDCAAYFFDRLSEIRKSDYLPSEQDVLRCRVMTTSITETKFAAPYQGHQVNFKVLDVGGQQGERRKWIALFDNVTAVLFVQDLSSFDQTLREDSPTNRLLESLKVFYQVITTKYLSNVSILAFMNKIDILKEKIERGADFEAALEKIKEEALENSLPEQETEYRKYSDHEKAIYRKLHKILVEHPYSAFKISDNDRRNFRDAFPQPEQDLNSNHIPITQKVKDKLLKKNSNSSIQQIEIDDEVIKAATYIKMLLQHIKAKVDEDHVKYDDNSFRAYEFHYTCAVDKANVRKVLEGCKNILVKRYVDSIIHF